MTTRSLPLALLFSLALSSGGARADHFQLDPVHSFVSFRAGHIALGYVFGRFNEVSGDFDFTDDAVRTLTGLQASVSAASVDTNNKDRDADLSANYFESAQFPKVEFQTTAVKRDAAGDFIVGGNLTLHGVTKAVTVKLKKRGEGKDPWQGYRLGLYGSLVVKRSEYGMTKELLAVDDDVALDLSFEGVKQ